jgi:outer membrane protein assembly factor BamB
MTGRVRWRDSLSGPSGAADPLRAYQAATGRLAWQAAIPSFVQSPPVPVPGDVLVQSADPMYACID